MPYDLEHWLGVAWAILKPTGEILMKLAEVVSVWYFVYLILKAVKGC